MQKGIDSIASAARSPRCAPAILTTPLVAPSVWAHAYLMHQYPAANAQVIAVPQAITLNFSGGVEAGFSGAEVTGLKDKNIKTLPAKRNEQDQKRLIVPLADSLRLETYTVDWHIVLVDGHKTEGHYTLSVK